MLHIDDSNHELIFGKPSHIASRNKKLVAERLPAFLLKDFLMINFID